MITRIEALNYRCLKHVSQPLSNYHVLVGPNASGKSTFLDVLSFLRTLITQNAVKAVNERTQNFIDLVFGRKGNSIHLAVEFKLPNELTDLLRKGSFDTFRYEVAIENNDSEEFHIVFERGLLTYSHELSLSEIIVKYDLTSDEVSFVDEPQDSYHTIFVKVDGRDIFRTEPVTSSQLYSKFSFAFNNIQSIISNMPGDIDSFPISMYYKRVLSTEFHNITVSSELLRKAAPPGKGTILLPDGSNLPWTIDSLKADHPERYNDWIAHIQTALPDLADIDIKLREDDRHKYLMLKYNNGTSVPSWMCSDGTLRLLALTIIAYMPKPPGIYLIEEPENGIHPQAIETVVQSLSSVYDAQVMLATHSPLILSMTDPSQVLCFSKDEEGATRIISGSDHPRLKDWRNDPDLGTLFASGVLD